MSEKLEQLQKLRQTLGISGKSIDWALMNIDQLEKECNEVREELKIYRKNSDDLFLAIERSGYDILDCSECGSPVVFLPGGLAICKSCAEQTNDKSVVHPWTPSCHEELQEFASNFEDTHIVQWAVFHLTAEATKLRK